MLYITTVWKCTSELGMCEKKGDIKDQLYCIVYLLVMAQHDIVHVYLHSNTCNLWSIYSSPDVWITLTRFILVSPSPIKRAMRTILVQQKIHFKLSFVFSGWLGRLMWGTSFPTFFQGTCSVFMASHFRLVLHTPNPDSMMIHTFRTLSPVRSNKFVFNYYLQDFQYLIKNAIIFNLLWQFQCILYM